jgi:hypothetical protein
MEENPVSASTPKRSRKSVSRKKKTGKKKSVARRPQSKLLQVRTSERSTHSRCPWQWNWGYNERLAPRREQPALKFGTLIHEALELRYPPGIKRGPKPAETFEKLFKAQQKGEEDRWAMKVDDEWEDMLGVGIEMMEAFIEEYGRDEDWKVIASEMTFQVPVYIEPWMRVENGGTITDDLLRLAGVTKGQAFGEDPLFEYVGTMDGVWENRMDASTAVNDWKTTSGDPKKEAMGKAALDEQTTAYWTWGVDWLVNKKILKPRQLEALDGMIFTFLAKKKRDTRPQNAQGLYLNLPTKKEKEEFGDDYPGSPSKKQPTPMFHRERVYRSEIEQTRARERAVSEVLVMMAMRRGVLPITKSPGTGFPSQQCNACSFRDMCELDEGGGDVALLRASSMDTWDPYSAHEIKEAEQK